ncbi:MAG TPA: hypothetical protein VLI05_04625 [Candidatus Saccharimonadia bacterium]|nr:hypothetical protein [Candidatus Saccharimonadia bacterium]
MTTTAQSFWFPARRNYSLLGVAIVLYLGFTSFAPTTSSAIHLEPIQLMLLRLTLTIPYLITWVLGVYGLTLLDDYLRSKATAGREFAPLMAGLRRGLWWVVIGLVVSAIIGSLRPYFTEPISKPVITIITNYLYVFPLLIGVWEIFRGIEQLKAAYRKIMAQSPLSDAIIKTIIILVIGAFYVFLVFTNPNRQVPQSNLILASYYLPDWLIVLTIIVPVFVTWWLGFSVAFTLNDLLPYLSSTDYFKSLTRVMYGLWAIIFSSILLQSVLSLGAARLVTIGLGALLLVLFAFILLQGFGFLLLALGIKRLRTVSAKVVAP